MEDGSKKESNENQIFHIENNSNMNHSQIDKVDNDTIRGTTPKEQNREGSQQQGYDQEGKGKVVPNLSEPEDKKKQQATQGQPKTPGEGNVEQGHAGSSRTLSEEYNDDAQFNISPNKQQISPKRKQKLVKSEQNSIFLRSCRIRFKK